MPKKQINTRIDTEIIREIESRNQSMTTYVTNAVNQSFHLDKVVTEAINKIKTISDDERANITEIAATLDEDHTELKNLFVRGVNTIRQDIHSMPKHHKITGFATSKQANAIICYLITVVIISVSILISFLYLIFR